MRFCGLKNFRSQIEVEKKKEFSIEKLLSASYIKIFMAFAQLLKIVSQIGFKVTKEEQAVNSSVEMFTGAIFNVISFDCFLQRGFFYSF